MSGLLGDLRVRLRLLLRRHTLNPTVEDTDQLAAAAHLGQVDKAGKPYIDHPRTVARILAEEGHDQRTIMAGLLHDVVEDTYVTMNQLRYLGYPEEIIRAIDSVTRREGPEYPGGKEPYMDLIRRAAADPIGKWVKLADNATNSDPERLALLSEDEQAWFAEKYAKARAVLLGERP